MFDESLEYGVPLLFQGSESMSRHRYTPILVLLDAQVGNADLTKVNLVDLVFAVLLRLHCLKLHQLLLLLLSQLHLLVHTSKVNLFFCLNLNKGCLVIL